MSNDSTPLRFVLASGSPRRRELLSQFGFDFEVRAADIDETPRSDEPATEYVRRLALEKAAAGRAIAAASAPTSGTSAPSALVVLAADTIVVLDGELLGKPSDADDARVMLRRLSGREHDVYSGVAVCRDALGRAGQIEDVQVVHTSVRFAGLEPADIEWYVGTGDPLDKAGAYGMQGRGACFVERISGSPTNVIGLPMHETITMLRRAGVSPRS